MWNSYMLYWRLFLFFFFFFCNMLLTMFYRLLLMALIGVPKCSAKLPLVVSSWFSLGFTCTSVRSQGISLLALLVFPHSLNYFTSSHHLLMLNISSKFSQGKKMVLRNPKIAKLLVFNFMENKLRILDAGVKSYEAFSIYRSVH